MCDYCFYLERKEKERGWGVAVCTCTRQYRRTWMWWSSMHGFFSLHNASLNRLNKHLKRLTLSFWRGVNLNSCTKGFFKGRASSFSPSSPSIPHRFLQSGSFIFTPARDRNTARIPLGFLVKSASFPRRVFIWLSLRVIVIGSCVSRAQQSLKSRWIIRHTEAHRLWPGVWKEHDCACAEPLGASQSEAILWRCFSTHPCGLALTFFFLFFFCSDNHLKVPNENFKSWMKTVLVSPGWEQKMKMDHPVLAPCSTLHPKYMCSKIYMSLPLGMILLTQFPFSKGA